MGGRGASSGIGGSSARIQSSIHSIINRAIEYGLAENRSSLEKNVIAAIAEQNNISTSRAKNEFEKYRKNRN